jgi:hypothetical protein
MLHQFKTAHIDSARSFSVDLTDILGYAGYNILHLNHMARGHYHRTIVFVYSYSLLSLLLRTFLYHLELQGSSPGDVLFNRVFRDRYPEHRWLVKSPFTGPHQDLSPDALLPKITYPHAPNNVLRKSGRLGAEFLLFTKLTRRNCALWELLGITGLYGRILHACSTISCM